MEKYNLKKRFAAVMSIISNSILILLKIFVGVISGSISIISEALHSLVDLAASLIAFFSVLKSSKPADDDHPYGHGKYEDLAGFIEAILIILTALYIMYIAAEKIITGGINHHFETDIGIWVMIVSIIVNVIVSRYLFFVAKETDSIALETDAQHLSADIYSSVAILLGLFTVKITGFYLLDPIFAIIVAILILKTGWDLTKQSSNNLLDGALPEEDKKSIENTLEEFKNEGLMGVKSVKTTKSGCKKLIQLVIFLPCDISLKNAHSLCDRIEHRIEIRLLNSDIIIHAEPFCNNKNVINCPRRMKNN